ncbi:MAG: dihydropteroate synthase [Phycisphaeraceae bacterium]|nr:dihydropteroate synthase [Phycisphaeraceae bacterium]
MARWSFAPDRSLPLDRPRFIAILNLTPDSFHDGGVLSTPEDALAAAERAVTEGADMLDLGGESTRPGAPAVPASEQIRRVVPAIRLIRQRMQVPISVDTTSAAVAAAALDSGADVVNDTSAGRDDPSMLVLIAQRRCGVVLMHRLRPPAQDSYSDRYREAPRYNDVVADVRDFLAERAAAATDAGIARGAIVIDPGLGFGKTVEQNLELIRRTRELKTLGVPILSALSRKSFVGRVQGLTESTPAQRLPGTISLSIAHHLAGACLFRVHDVGAVAQALRAAAAAVPT